jgi:hypothetical protein
MVWGGVLKVLAETLGVEFDEVDEIIERRPLERTIELPIGTFEAGTQGAFRLQVRGLVGGEEKIVMDHVTRIDDECALDWPIPPEQSMGCHQVLVTGDPDVTLTLTAEDADGDRNVGGIALSAGSPLREDLNTAILRMREDDTLDRIKDAWLGKHD